MPSLPTSLIVVGLVVAWLVVLVPMVARRREEVPENNEEGANFRVLRRSSGAGRRRPILSRTAMAHRSRDDADADDGEGASDEDRDHDLEDVDAPVVVGGDSEDHGAIGDGDNAGVVGGAGVRGNAGFRDAADMGARVSASATVAVNEKDEVDAGARRDFERSDYRAERSTAPGSYGRGTTGERMRPAGADERGVAGERMRLADTTYDVSRGGAESTAYGRSERVAAGEYEFRGTPMRRGRGGFDPAAADRARAYRFRQRRRVALALIVIAAAGAAVGLLGIGYGYVAATAGGVLLVLYLAYLRRQVRVENEIRARRVARLTRARQIRPGYRPSVAEQVYAHRTGEIPRPGVVGEYRIKSHARESVPSNGYGYGEPVDFEDSDPAFDDLEYYRPAAFGRRAG